MTTHSSIVKLKDALRPMAD